MFATSIYIIEDNFYYRSTLKKLLNAAFQKNPMYSETEVIEVTNVIYFFNDLETRNFSAMDIFLIDIDLNTYFDGITLATKIRIRNANCKIIFLTSFENRAIDVINANISPRGYIVKTSNKESLLFQLMQLLDTIMQDSSNDNNKLIIRTGYKDRLIPYNEIMYISIVSGMKNTLITVTESQELMFSSTLTEIKKTLPSPPFILNLKSYILNANNIKHFSQHDGMVHFNNHRELYLSSKLIRKISRFQQVIDPCH